MPIRILAVLAAAVLVVPAAAQQMIRCVGKDGKTYIGQTMPPECIGVATQQLNPQGTVVKQSAAPLTAAEREKLEAEDRAKKEREAQAKEEARKNRALLSTYTSEKDVDIARSRALADNEKAVRDIEQRIAGIRKRQGELAKELEFFQGKNKPPAKLNEDIKNGEIDLRAQEELLAAKRREVNTINARYDEDRRRFVELTKGKPAAK